MTSMPEPTNPRTIELAEGHVMHTCCGKLDDAEHWNFCPNWRAAVAGSALPVDEVREFARRAAAHGFAINPDGDPSYLVERINLLLAEGVEPTPPESEWADLPACPAWCTGKHPDDRQFRDCQSEEFFVPQYRDGVASVDLVTTFDRAQGVATPVLVRVEDYSFTPQYARHLAQLLIRAADLADADA